MVSLSSSLVLVSAACFCDRFLGDLEFERCLLRLTSSLVALLMAHVASQQYILVNDFLQLIEINMDRASIANAENVMSHTWSTMIPAPRVAAAQFEMNAKNAANHQNRERKRTMAEGSTSRFLPRRMREIP